MSSGANPDGTARRIGSARTTVLVDGRHLAGFGATRGFGRYLRALLGRLEAQTTLSIAALVTEEGRDAVPAGCRPVLVQRRLPGRLADFEHRMRLPVDIARHRSGIFLSPAQEPPRWCGRPWVQTIHDVPLSFGGAEGSRELAAWRKRRRRVTSAAAVIAVSRYVAEQAVAIFGLDPARVHVVRHGVESAFSPPAERHSDGGRPRAEHPYLLLVSEYGPHKGYREAFELIGVLAERGLPHRLVVVGRLAPWWRPDVDALLTASAHPERVELAGLADDDRLIEWYRGADALLVTSRAEGFGLPIIEAMACATPVIAFDNTALPEIVGRGGILTPDGDVAQLAAAVEALVADPARWRGASAAAQERSRAFSWETSAAAHASIFHDVLASSGRSG